MDYSSLNRKKILITGGLGFIGSNLAIRLVELGAEVTIVDNLMPKYGGNLWNIEPVKDKVRVNISDVRNRIPMRYLIKGQDYLLNLAGQTSHLDSMEDPYTDLDINTHAQLSILEACRRYNKDIRLVFASTRQIYGKPDYLPVDENHPLRPVDVNGINKLAGENYHLIYNKVYGIRSCVLRLTNTYGPRMRIKDARQTFLGIWIRSLIEEKPIMIYGDGKQARDYNYIDDVVEAILLSAVNDQSIGEVYNLGGRKKYTLTETARLMAKLAQNGRYEYMPFPQDRKVIDIGDYWGDYQKIERDLGWLPKTELKAGMKKTYDYFSENIQHYR